VKRKVVVFAAIVLGAASVFAQHRAALTIICNYSGASVLVAGRMVGTTTPNLTVLLPEGTFPVKVVKPGFQPFDAMVVLPTAGYVLTVTLIPYGASVAPQPAPPPPMQASTYPLTVQASVPNSHVIINGADQGMAPITRSLIPGTYNVTIRSPGMMDWTQQVQIVNGPVTVSPNMQPQSYPFQASANNAPGATIFINGNQVGTGNYNASLPPGTYTMVIRAPGFNDYTETFNLSGPMSRAISMQQALVSFTFSIPPNYLNPEARDYLGRRGDFGQGRSVATFELLVDGRAIPPAGNDVWSGAVTPGTHDFKILSGGLLIENSIDLEPGRNWVLQPSLGISAQ